MGGEGCGHACRFHVLPFWTSMLLRAILKESSGDGLVLRSPALAHREVRFGQMGKVWRSSRTTVVNEALDFGLPIAVAESLCATHNHERGPQRVRGTHRGLRRHSSAPCARLVLPWKSGPAIRPIL